ncbi:MAG TPA: dTDP-4-dehydrorhamnose reductase [Thermoanaerobaculia bacterium]
MADNHSIRWMITGADGMLGNDLADRLASQGYDVVALTKGHLDITDRKHVLETARQLDPHIIVNCAAYTKVDDCEANLETANLVNGTAVGHLAEAANEEDALLVQISTDFVFDGSSTRPYETDDPTFPLSAYGASKLLGEKEAELAKKHLIVRAAWLFGRNGHNFVEAIRKQVASGKSELRVVNDQRGCPTYTPHLAEAIEALGREAAEHRSARGVAHYADAPECSWYDFAIEIVRRLRPDGGITVRPVTTDEFPRPARRPAYSVLSTRRYERITGKTPASWKDGLEKYLRV